ncbi:hypothetical protein AAMO2058_001196000 [Amorphochlora amoebiformis]
MSISGDGEGFGSSREISSSEARRRIAQAVSIALGTTPADRSTIAKANEYIQSVKDSARGWILCARELESLDKVDPSSYNYVFFCLEVIWNAATSSGGDRYVRAPLQARVELRRVLLKAMEVMSVLKASSFPSFLKTKLAVTVVGILRHDYPSTWPDFFTNILKGLQKGGIGRADIFLRVLQAVDQEEVKHINHIKKHMHQTCIKPVVGALISIAGGLASSHHHIAKNALNILREYTAWISVDIVASNHFLKQIYGFISNPRLRDSAVEILNEVIRKRSVDSIQKIALIDRTKVLELISSAKSSNDQDYSESLAALADSIVVQAIGCCRDLDTRAREARVDRKGDFEAKFKNGAKRSLAIAMESMKIVIAYGQAGDFRVAEQITDCMDSYMHFLHHAHRYANEYPTKEQAILLAGTIQSLENFFVSCAQCFPKLTAPVLISRIEQIMANPSQVKTQEVEAVFRLFYKLYEGISDKGPEWENVTSQIMARIIESGASRSENHTLPLIVLELTARYSHFLEKYPKYLKGVIKAFLDERGMGHSHPQVRGRACYQFESLLKRLSKGARNSMKPYLEDVLRELQKKVLPVLNRDLKTGKASGTPLSVESTLVVCEAMGILCSSVFSPQNGPKMFTSSLQALREAIIRLASQQEACKADLQLAGQRLSDMIKMLASLTKPVTRDAKVLQEPLIACLQTVLTVFSSLPEHKEVRLTTIFYMHRMVTCLKDRAVPLLKKPIVCLLEHTDAESYTHTCSIIYQIVDTSDSRVVIEFVEEVFRPLYEKTHQILRDFSFIDEKENTVAYASHIEDRDDIVKKYFSILRNTITAHCFRALVTPRNMPCFKQALKLLIEATDRSNMSLVKGSLDIFRRMLNWAKNAVKESGPIADFFKELLGQELTSATIRACCSPHIDPGDAKASMVMMCIAEIHLHLSAIFGKEFVMFLSTQLANRSPAVRMSLPFQKYIKFCEMCVPDSRLVTKYAFTARDSLRGLIAEMRWRRRPASRT